MLSMIATNTLIALILVLTVSHSTGQSSSSVAPPTTKDAFVSMETESPPLITSHTSVAITSSSSSSLLPAANNSSITTFSSLSQNLSSPVAPSQPTRVATSVFSMIFPMTHSTPQPMPTTLAPSFKPSSSQVYTTPELPSTTLGTWVSSHMEDVNTTTPVSMESESLPPVSQTLPASNTTTAQPTISLEVTTEDPLVPKSVAPTNQSIASDTTESTTQDNTTMMRVTSTTEGAVTDITLLPGSASMVTREQPLLPTSVAPIQPTNHSTPNVTGESTTQGNASTIRTMSTTEGAFTDITILSSNASVVPTDESPLSASMVPIQPTNHSTPNSTRESSTQGSTTMMRAISTTEVTVTDITLLPTNASVVTKDETHLPTSVAPIQPTNYSTPNVTGESTTQGNASTIRTMSSTEGAFTDITIPSTNASVFTKEESPLSTSMVPIQPTNHYIPNSTRESTSQGSTTMMKVISTTEGAVTDITLLPTNASIVTGEEPHLPTSVAPIQPTNYSTPNVTRESTTQGNASTITTMSTTQGAFTDISIPSTSVSVVTNKVSLLSTSMVPIQPTNHSTPNNTREFTAQGSTSTMKVASTIEDTVTGTVTAPQANTSVVPTEEVLLPTSVTSIQPTTHSLADNTSESTTQSHTNMTKVNSTTEGAVTGDVTTEGIFTTNGTTPLVSPVSPTLDKSFATMEFWVMMELTVPMETDVRDSDFLSDLETNLAKSYQEARQRQLEKENEVKQLLRKLNPEDDIFLRVRRASTVDGNTAQIIDLSRDSEVQTTGELVYYINADGTNIPAMECATTFAELSLQELTLLIDMVVIAPVTAYNVIPTSPAPSRDTTFIIILSICIPFACLFCCMCSFCTYCVICGPKRARNERTMSPDTFKMLEFKQKFPYKPYTPNQTPRPNMDYPPSDDEEFLSRSNKRVSIAGVWEESSPTARIIPDATSLSSSFRLPEKLPLSNRGLESSVRISEPPVVSYRDDSDQLQASPSNKDENLEETSTRQLPAPPSSFLTDPNYVAAQMEISKILEPENVTEVKKPRKKRRKKVTSKAATTEDADKETATGSWVQLPNDTQPEPISEARQKVHALIEEAFSLVNFKGMSSTVVTKLPSQEGGEPPKEGATESKPIVDSHVMDLLTGRKKELGIQTMQPNQESKVVVVPVHTPSPAETSSVLWNPYAARDELQKISPTREPASLPGDVNSFPPDDSYVSKRNSSRPKETERPHYPEGAEYASSLFGDSLLDHSLKIHEYARSSESPFENRFGSNESPLTIGSGPRSLRDNNNGRTLGNSSYLTEFEKERRGRASEYYDELDITGVMARGRPSRSLLDSIRSELMGTGRRIGDGKEVTEW